VIQRLTRSDFAALVSKGGQRLHGKYFSVVVARLPTSGGKYACVVSSKIARKATARNHIKRRCRESVRRHMSTHAQGLAFTLYAKRAAAGATFDDIDRDISALFARISN